MQRLRPIRLIQYGAALTLLVASSPVHLPEAYATGTKASFHNPAEPNDRSPDVYQGSFLDLTTKAMLARLHVTVYPEDKVFAFPDPALGIGSQIRIYRAQAVLINDGGSQRLVRTWAPTVDALATEQGLDLAEKDMVDPPRTTALKSQERPYQVTITRVAEAEIQVSAPIDYKTTYVDNDQLERGQEKVQQAGQTGTLVRTFLVRRENGVEVSRTETKEEVTKQPVAKIIQRGTKIVTYGTGQASWYSGVASMTAAHRTLPIGTLVQVVNVANGKSVTVRIADRGPFVDGRIIDLSKDAFNAIAGLGSGVVTVRLEKE